MSHAFNTCLSCFLNTFEQRETWGHVTGEDKCTDVYCGQEITTFIIDMEERSGTTASWLDTCTGLLAAWMLKLA